MPAPPCAHVGEQRHELDGRFGQAVDALLLMRDVIATADQSGVEEAVQAAGQNIRCDAFLGFAEQLAEVAAVAEHQIADDEETPVVAQHLQRQIDRASRTKRVHSCLQNRLQYRIGYAYSTTGCDMQLVRERATS